MNGSHFLDAKSSFLTQWILIFKMITYFRCSQDKYTVAEKSVNHCNAAYSNTYYLQTLHNLFNDPVSVNQNSAPPNSFN